jgi:LuxR family maltose regulon positive regulatory protein
LLNRERLNSLLSFIYDYPLTIVTAPIGYGKTTAVRSFLQSEKCHPLWISFLNSEESTTFFWSKFTSELERLSEKDAARLKALGFPVTVPQYEKVLEILSGIRLKRNIVLVVDDFHLSSDPAAGKFLMQLVLEKIEKFHVVIITRNTTNLDYTGPLSKGLCQIITQQNLKFSEDEVREFCTEADDRISKADLKRINNYTDGWISLIYLVLVGMENGVPIGMNDSIDDLIDKVFFQVYDEHIKGFLYKLSIMNSFTAEMAMSVTQEQKTYDILKELHRENAFVYYDQTSKTYRIHNVLLDYLRLKCPYSAEQLQMLYRQLGEWYLEKNDFPSAYAYFNRAGETERILAHLNDPRNIRNELTLFEGSFEMFRKIPVEVLNRYPLAYLQHILLSIVQGDEKSMPETAERLYTLQKAYKEMEGTDEKYRERILAEILIINKFLIFNHLDLGDDYNRNILRLLNGQQSYIMQRDNEFTFGSPHLLYIYFRDPGTLKAIADAGAVSFTSYSQFADGCGTGSDYLLAAEYALETGDWEAAELNSRKAVYKAKTKDQTSIIICAKFTLIRLAILQGQIKEAIAVLKELEEEIHDLNNSFYNTTIDMCRGYVYACLGRPEMVPYWLQTGAMKEGDLLYQGVSFNYIVYGKSLLASGNYVALEIMAESSRECFAIFSNQLGFIHNGIFEAVAKYRLYGIREGAAVLRNVLLETQKDDIIMPFAENAPHLIEILESIVNADFKNEYLKRVLTACEQYMKSLKSNRVKKISLSGREVEVLSLAADGLKRDEIASRLMVSQGTVKTHLQNIYQKLDVSGKTTAIKIAQMHGLI